MRTFKKGEEYNTENGGHFTVSLGSNHSTIELDGVTYIVAQNKGVNKESVLVTVHGVPFRLFAGVAFGTRFGEINDHGF